MQKKRLNNTELELSPLGLGTVNFGSKTPATDAERQLDIYLDAGGNLIDTAHIYGRWEPGEESLSELVIGAWLRKTGKRNHVLISTKGAHPPLDDMHAPRLAPADIEADLHDSLRHLGVDCVDLYYLHRDDPSLPVEPIVDCLERAVKAGKIRCYGCSNWSVGRIREANAYAKANGGGGFVCNQLMWSLADINASGIHDDTLRLMDAETMAFHTQTGLGAMAYTSAAKGYFAKRASGSPVREGLSALYQNPSNDEILGRLVRIGEESGVSVNRLCLLYIMCQPFASVALVSSTSDAQLRDSLALLAGDYPPSLVRELAALKRFVY